MQCDYSCSHSLVRVKKTSKMVVQMITDLRKVQAFLNVAPFPGRTNLPLLESRSSAFLFAPPPPFVLLAQGWLLLRFF